MLPPHTGLVLHLSGGVPDTLALFVFLLQGPLHVEIELTLLLQPLLLHISHDALMHSLDELVRKPIGPL